MDDRCKQLNPLTAIIRDEIGVRGPVSFSRFMELGLYHPEHGYYERDTGLVGRAGDFVTSVSVGPLLGRLLARCFAAEHKHLAVAHGPGAKGIAAQFVEAGAHDGRLASDLMTEWTAISAVPFGFTILEPSPGRRAWQERTTSSHRNSVRWLAGWLELPERSVHGFIFGNELLDALPVHRLRWHADQRHWSECLVNWDGEAFHWQFSPDGAEPALVARVPECLRQAAEFKVLPDGWLTEVSPMAVEWWQQAASRLASGWLLTLDYGLEDDEYLQPDRQEGSLRAYRNHRLSANVLADPGEQDLTAHVNFTALRRAGEVAGLETVCCGSQSTFLMEIAAKLEPGFWDASSRRQLQTLTHPEFFGRKFRVLVQRRRPGVT